MQQAETEAEQPRGNMPGSTEEISTSSSIVSSNRGRGSTAGTSESCSQACIVCWPLCIHIALTKMPGARDEEQCSFNQVNGLRLHLNNTLCKLLCLVLSCVLWSYTVMSSMVLCSAILLCRAVLCCAVLCCAVLLLCAACQGSYRGCHPRPL